MPIAITTINGYPAPFAQRFALYRAAEVGRRLETLLKEPSL